MTKNCLIENCTEMCEHSDDIYCNIHLDKFAVMKLRI